jgi:hypothetical protein
MLVLLMAPAHRELNRCLARQLGLPCCINYCTVTAVEARADVQNAATMHIRMSSCCKPDWTLWPSSCKERAKGACLADAGINL